MKKITLLTLSLSFLIVLPATAQLGKVWTDFQSYSTDLQNYLTNNVNDSLKPVEFIQSQYAINSATGELKIPNPVALGENDIFLNSISDKFDKFENNPVVRSSLVNNEINRLITRSSAESVLGVTGQNRTKTKLEDTENRLEKIGVFNEDIDENQQTFLNDIQDQIIRAASNATLLGQLIGIRDQTNLQYQQVKIQREQVKIVAETLGQTIQTNQSLQYTNLNLASLSQQIEDTNRARRVDASAEAARLLRTTSQTDLFGRQTNN